MIKKIITTVSILLFNQLCFSQLIVSSQIIDESTQQPIEFANVGIVGAGVGTVCDESGKFSFTVPDSLKQQSIKISSIGYQSKSISVTEAGLLKKIALKPATVTLNEVAITVKKSKIKLVGNVTKHKSVRGGFTKNNLGSEIAIKLNIKEKKTHIRKFFVNILSSTIEKPIFRLNIYKKDVEGGPGENILKQNVIVEPTQALGLVEFDLSTLNIFVDEDTFIALEWIKDLGDVKGLYFSTKLIGTGTYFRKASQDKWQKISPAGLGLYAEIAY
jgi:hypothetical protein